MAYVCAAITAPKLKNPSQTLVGGGGAGSGSRELSAGGLGINLSCFNDMLERNEGGDEENQVVRCEQFNPCTSLVHQVSSQYCL